MRLFFVIAGGYRYLVVAAMMTAPMEIEMAILMPDSSGRDVI